MAENRPYTPNEVLIEAIKKANEVGIPARLIAALLQAESGLKWNAARYAYWDGTQYINRTDRAEAALARGDFSDFAGVLVELNNWGSQDVSFGVGQQTVRWANEGTHELTVENVVNIRDLYFNVPHAVDVATQEVVGYYKQYGDVLEALCRYNKPSIPGYLNPNRQNYIDALTIVDPMLTITPSTPTPVEPHPLDMVTVSFMPSTVQGTMNPIGIILHGSRSGAQGNPKHQEFLGTARYCVNNPDGLSWNVTVGEDEYAVHLEANQWGWHARRASDKYIGVEFAQATVDEAISDAQVAAFAHYFQNHVLPVVPNIALHFPTHSEVEHTGETGIVDGKTDVFPYGDPRTDELRTRIFKALQNIGVSTPTTTPTPPVVTPTTPDDHDAPQPVGDRVSSLETIIGYLTVDVAKALRESVVDKKLPDAYTKKDLVAFIGDLQHNAQAVAEEIERHKLTN